MTTFIPGPELLGSPRGRRLPGWDAASLLLANRSLDDETDVLVAGAGPAGLAAVTALWHLGVRDVVVLDPSGRICGTFFDRVNALSQSVLRSPYEHHPGAEGHRDCELLDHARLSWEQLTDVERHQVRMAQSGQRGVVPLDVFEAFVMHLARAHQVADRGRTGRLLSIQRSGTALLAETTLGSVRAGAVVLAMGEQPSEAPARWNLPNPLPATIRHWHTSADPVLGPAVVVGSGLSAAHLIARQLQQGGTVTWVQRRSERYQCADVNASFFRPEGRAHFSRATRDGRAALLRQHRQPSIMFEFRPLLQSAERDGRLRVLRNTEIAGITGDAERAELTLEDGSRIPARGVLLALGTSPADVSEVLGHACQGSPADLDVNDATLELTAMPGVFLTGAQAAKAVGPASRNLDGHRVAAQRISRAIVAASAGHRPERTAGQL